MLAPERGRPRPQQFPQLQSVWTSPRDATSTLLRPRTAALRRNYGIDYAKNQKDNQSRYAWNEVARLCTYSATASRPKLYGATDAGRFWRRSAEASKVQGRPCSPTRRFAE